jgi:hypothetical protein
VDLLPRDHGALLDLGVPFVRRRCARETWRSKHCSTSVLRAARGSSRNRCFAARATGPLSEGDGLLVAALLEAEARREATPEVSETSSPRSGISTRW